MHLLTGALRFISKSSIRLSTYARNADKIYRDVGKAADRTYGWIFSLVFDEVNDSKSGEITEPVRLMCVMNNNTGRLLNIKRKYISEYGRGFITKRIYSFFGIKDFCSGAQVENIFLLYLVLGIDQWDVFDGMKRDVFLICGGI